MKYEAASNLPYPTVQVEKENILYGEILLQDLAGKTSEETSIHKYLYQCVTQEKFYPEIAEVLERIAKVEMHHLKILLRLITMLGVDAQYRTLECYQEQPIFWKGQYVNYETDIHKLLELSIKQEQKVIDQYQNHIQVIQDSYIRKNLQRIILDEKVHIETLKKLQNIIK